MAPKIFEAPTQVDRSHVGPFGRQVDELQVAELAGQRGQVT